MTATPQVRASTGQGDQAPQTSRSRVTQFSPMIFSMRASVQPRRSMAGRGYFSVAR